MWRWIYLQKVASQPFKILFVSTKLISSALPKNDWAFWQWPHQYQRYCQLYCYCWGCTRRCLLAWRGQSVYSSIWHRKRCVGCWGLGYRTQKHDCLFWCFVCKRSRSAHCYSHKRTLQRYRAWIYFSFLSWCFGPALSCWYHGLDERNHSTRHDQHNLRLLDKARAWFKCSIWQSTGC